ncbi:MAG TPA: hypothetical protein ENG03_08730 [Thioploca sp.]|nr:hypothetical protein [Thioploca sp.]
MALVHDRCNPPDHPEIRFFQKIGFLGSIFGWYGSLRDPALGETIPTEKITASVTSNLAAKATVLIVDDKPVNLQMLHTFLYKTIILCIKLKIFWQVLRPAVPTII